MNKHNQDGAVNATVISLVFAVLLLIGALVFGGWAFNSRQDYKNNVDSKIAAAVTVAQKQQGNADAAKFAELAKQPLTTYNGPEAYGSLVINYPKTWSGYVDSTGTGQALVDGYFNPGTVPSITSKDSVFALRVQVINQPYAQVLQNFTNLTKNPRNPLSFSAYSLPKLPKIVGIKAVGQITQQTTGTMVVLPLRSDTLEISTQGTQYQHDYDTYILPNFSFSP